jgi:hypothetical protein
METAPMATHDFVPQFLGSLLSKADAPAATKAVATKAVVKEAAPAPEPLAEAAPTFEPPAPPAEFVAADVFGALQAQVASMSAELAAVRAELAALDAKVDAPTAPAPAQAMCEGYLEAAGADLVPYPPQGAFPPIDPVSTEPEGVLVEEDASDEEVTDEEAEAVSSGSASEEEEVDDEDGAPIVTLSKGVQVQTAHDITSELLDECRVDDMHQLCGFLGIEVPPRSKKAKLRQLIAECVRDLTQ